MRVGKVAFEATSWRCGDRLLAAVSQRLAALVERRLERSRDDEHELTSSN